MGRSPVVRPTRFETTVVTTAADGSIVIALFDGAEVPVSLAVLECSREAAIALRNNLGSALRSRASARVREGKMESERMRFLVPPRYSAAREM
jgi:hypothetical protein